MSDNIKYYCHMCGRNEEQAGKMLHLPGGMNICVDCLQKTLDQFGNSGYPMPPFYGMPSNNVPADFGQNAVQEQEKTGITDSEGSETVQGQVIDVTVNEDANPDEKEKEKEKKEEQPNSKRGMPNISFINLADLQAGFGRRAQVKKKNPKDKAEPPIDASKVLPPHKLKEKLDEFVVGQEKTKKIISVAVYNHYKRILAGKRLESEDGIEIEKSNLLMIGPTGCGKTHIVRTLAKLLDVPLAVTDATSLTEAGYIGDDVESVLSKLLQAADNDVDKAEIGIVFIDEIDKIAKKTSNRGRDVSGESVQQGLLKLLEGSEVEVPVGATSKNAMVPLTTMNTKNILFICGGAFPDLEDIIKQRIMSKTTIGFNSELKDSHDKDDVISQVKTEDLREFGMIPEFLGRLPIITTLQKLSDEMLVRVLTEPKNAILKQYKKLLELDEVDLVFEDDALLSLTKRAEERETGARGLRSIIEEVMLDIMYEIPKDDSIGRVIITKDYIENHGAPIIELRGAESMRQPQGVALIEQKTPMLELEKEV